MNKKQTIYYTNSNIYSSLNENLKKNQYVQLILSLEKISVDMKKLIDKEINKIMLQDRLRKDGEFSFFLSVE